MEQLTSRVQDLLNQTGLNWNVITEGITTESGITLDGYKAIVREDTKTPLSIRSDEYYPYQNHELIELLDKVSNQTGLELKKGGFFKDGARVYVQLKSNDLRIGNDRVEGYLTGINSFDGSTSLAFGPSNITISCQNTFFAAFRELETKVRHTKNMVVKIDEICRSLESVIEQEKVIFDDILKLSETRFDDVIKDRVTKSLFNIKPEINLKDDDSVPTITRNKLSRFYVDLNGEISEKGDNLWGLFSGVTKYTTHSLTKNDNTEAKMFGIYGKRELEIFNDLVELV
jgi:phage/plasmid-like protein (TIGR03299 family)